MVGYELDLGKYTDKYMSVPKKVKEVMRIHDVAEDKPVPDVKPIIEAISPAVLELVEEITKPIVETVVVKPEIKKLSFCDIKLVTTVFKEKSKEREVFFVHNKEMYKWLEGKLLPFNKELELSINQLFEIFPESVKFISINA